MEGATRRTMRRALYGAGGDAGHDAAAPDEAAARPGCSERTSHAENGPQRAEAFDAAGEGAADLGAADLDVEERLPLPSLFSLQSLLRLLSLLRLTASLLSSHLTVLPIGRKLADAIAETYHQLSRQPADKLQVNLAMLALREKWISTAAGVIAGSFPLLCTLLLSPPLSLFLVTPPPSLCLRILVASIAVKTHTFQVDIHLYGLTSSQYWRST